MAASFEQGVLMHLDAAYNLARWLTGSDHDAEDVAQEAILRAWRFHSSFHGDDARAWLLKIVRNACYTWLRRNRPHAAAEALDDDLPDTAGDARAPETLADRAATTQFVRAALEELPVPYREMIILHDLEGLKYRQIADAVGVPLGTVMSRLARARQRLHDCLADRLPEEM